jgi:hypothetical protein
MAVCRFRFYLSSRLIIAAALIGLLKLVQSGPSFRTETVGGMSDLRDVRVGP